MSNVDLNLKDSTLCVLFPSFVIIHLSDSSSLLLFPFILFWNILEINTWVASSTEHYTLTLGGKGSAQSSSGQNCECRSIDVQFFLQDITSWPFWLYVLGYRSQLLKWRVKHCSKLHSSSVSGGTAVSPNRLLFAMIKLKDTDILLKWNVRTYL